MFLSSPLACKHLQDKGQKLSAQLSFSRVATGCCTEKLNKYPLNKWPQRSNRAVKIVSVREERRETMFCVSQWLCLFTYWFRMQWPQGFKFSSNRLSLILKQLLQQNKMESSKIIRPLIHLSETTNTLLQFWNPKESQRCLCGGPTAFNLQYQSLVCSWTCFRQLKPEKKQERTRPSARDGTQHSGVLVSALPSQRDLKKSTSCISLLFSTLLCSSPHFSFLPAFFIWSLSQRRIHHWKWACHGPYVIIQQGKS